MKSKITTGKLGNGTPPPTINSFKTTETNTSFRQVIDLNAPQSDLLHTMPLLLISVMVKTYRILDGGSDTQASRHIQTCSMTSGKLLTISELSHALKKMKYLHEFKLFGFLLGWPKSFFRFFHKVWQKNRMNFLANPMLVRIQNPMWIPSSLENKKKSLCLWQGWCTWNGWW